MRDATSRDRAAGGPAPDRFDIAVVGGGPAGCLTAIRLAAFGYRVALVARERRRLVVEGLSQRVLEVLRANGCTGALAAVGPEVTRVATWNAETSSRNREAVVERRAFDRALCVDAAAAGVRVLAGRIARLHDDGELWHLAGTAADGTGLSLAAGYLIEARGRQAPGRGVRRLRGPATTALGRVWSGLPPRPRTGVASFADGWAWLATTGDGRGVLQLLVSSAGGVLPKRSGLAAFYDTCRASVPEAADWLAGARPAGPVAARNAGAAMAAHPVSARLLRVGDAAVAVDPLSGNGVFEALGSALAAAPTIRTLLSRPAQAELAAAFYRQRATEAFLRYCRVGRDFYRLERRWQRRPFWTQRRHWPDDEPAHGDPRRTAPELQPRPVVEDGFIVEREVIVTADHPRGVYQVDGVPLAPLLRLLRRSPEVPAEARIARAATALARPSGRVATALDWLRYRRLLG